MAPVKQNTAFPTLRPADPRTADPGIVRLGDAAISGRFPQLRRPDERTADPGTVRLGDAAISGQYRLR
jgi:hypothetical protein